MDKHTVPFYAKVRFNFDGRIIYKLIYVYNSFKRERSALPENRKKKRKKKRGFIQ
jgi:hypothetical protein